MPARVPSIVANWITIGCVQNCDSKSSNEVSILEERIFKLLVCEYDLLDHSLA